MKLYIFDVDLTLANHNETALRSTAAYWLRQHKPQHIALATNQGGVGLRRWMEDGGFGEPGKYPTETAVRERIATIASNVQAITGGTVHRHRFEEVNGRSWYNPLTRWGEGRPHAVMQ